MFSKTRKGASTFGKAVIGLVIGLLIAAYTLPTGLSAITQSSLNNTVQMGGAGAVALFLLVPLFVSIGLVVLVLKEIKVI